jgi:hypothetical protein
MEINQYPLESFSFQDNDYYDIDFFTGSGYQTKKILGSVIKAGILAAVENIYNADGTLTGSRAVNIDGKNLSFISNNAGEFEVILGNGISEFSRFSQTLAQIFLQIQGSIPSDQMTFDLNPVNTQLTINDGVNYASLQINGVGSALNFTDGITQYRVEANENGVEINSSYILPNTDGTAGQVLTTDGAGVTSWQDSATTIVSWGDIVGTLADQTDLQTALDGKFDDPAGLPSQYVRGDGSLADFPAPVGAGSSVSFYLNGGTSQGTILGGQYYQLSKNASLATNADFSLNANGLIAQFITDNSEPKRTLIPAGNWNTQFYFNASSGGGTPTFYVEVHKYDGVAFTLLGTSSGSPETISGGTSIDLYYTSVAIPETILDIDDRIAIRVYITHDGRTITLHTQANHLSEVVTTFSTGIATLNGLTDQVQYFVTGSTGTNFNITSSGDTHTFNIPTSSASATGLLNSTDWNTFNNKADDNIYTADGTISGDRIINMDIHDLNILSSDATNQYEVFFNDGTRQTQLALSMGSISHYVKNTSGDSVSQAYGSTSTNTTVSNVGLTIFSEAINSQNNFTWRVVNGGTTRRLELNTLGLRVNNAYYLPATDGTSGQVLRTNGLGIASWITPSSGTVTSVGLSTGSTGTDVNVSGSPVTGSGSITLNIPTASATNRGALSSTDWTTFNNKGNGSVTNVSALTIGTTGSDVSSSVANSTTTPTITLNIPTASATNRGALNSSDWTTFNSKANTASPAFTGIPTTPTATTGTNTTQVASTAFVQDALSKRVEAIQVAASDEISALTVGNGKTTFRMPYAMTLTGIRASLTTAQTSGTIFTVDVKQNGVSILSTLLTIDNTEKTTTTAAIPAVISTSALTDDSEIRIDITQIGDGTAKGLKVTLLGTRS